MFVRSPAVLAFVSLVGYVASQSVDPYSVGDGIKAQWCLAQTSSCPLLCYQVDDSGNEPAANVCDAETLVYNCTCSNGKTPDSEEFSQTIPYFLCTERNNRCVEGCGGLSACASNCRQNNPCGATDPTRVTSAPGSSGPTATASSTSSATDTVHTGFAGGDGDGEEEEEEDAGVRSLSLGIGRVYVVGVLVAGFVGGFAVLL